MDAVFAFSIDKYDPNETPPIVSHGIKAQVLYVKEHNPLRNNEHNDLYQVLKIYIRDLKTNI